MIGRAALGREPVGSVTVAFPHTTASPSQVNGFSPQIGPAARQGEMSAS